MIQFYEIIVIAFWASMFFLMLLVKSLILGSVFGRKGKQVYTTLTIASFIITGVYTYSILGSDDVTIIGDNIKLKDVAVNSEQTEDHNNKVDKSIDKGTKDTNSPQPKENQQIPSWKDKEGNLLIIGNTNNSRGTKIYHVPGSQYYEQAKKYEGNNEYFRDIAEAEAHGYRAPR